MNEHKDSFQPRHRRVWPLALTLALLVFGLALRLPAMSYRGPFGPNPTNNKDLSPQEKFNNFVFERFAYTDILSLYYRDGLPQHPIPYIQYDLEYPVGIGAFTYVLSFARSPQAYFLLSYLLLSLCTLGTVVLLDLYGANVALLVLTPTIAINVPINWDMFAILPMIAALILARRGRMGWAGILLALSVWTKPFSFFLLPPILLALALDRRWRAAIEMAAGFGLVSLLMNVPIMLVDLRGWAHFLTFQGQRGAEIQLWALFPNLALPTLNLLLTTLLGLGILIGLAAVVPGDGHRLQRAFWAGFATLVWFLFIGKVYSPQYSLWILTLLAFLGAPWAMVVVFAGVDLIYFLYSFILLALGPYNRAQIWFYYVQMLPLMVIREAILLGITGWALWRAIGMGVPLLEEATAWRRSQLGRPAGSRGKIGGYELG